MWAWPSINYPHANIYIYIYQKIREKSKVEHNAINKEAEEVREETVPD